MSLFKETFLATEPKHPRENVYDSASTVPTAQTRPHKKRRKRAKIFRAVESITQEGVTEFYKLSLTKSRLLKHNISGSAFDITGINPVKAPPYDTPHITSGEEHGLDDYPLCVITQSDYHGDVEILLSGDMYMHINDPNVLIDRMVTLRSDILMIDVSLFNSLTRPSRQKLFNLAYKEIWIYSRGF